MPRIVAWQVVCAHGSFPLHAVDGAADDAELEPRDRALVRKIVGTEVRRRGTLRALVEAFAKGKPSSDVSAHLRLGFVQLFFMDQVPPHAAVSETVGATHRTLGPGRARYVNAVLREALRASRVERIGDPRRDVIGRNLSFDRDVFRDPAQHPLLWAEDALSMPAALLKRWSKRHGKERALELARTALDEPPLSVRAVPASAAACEALAAELALLEPRPAAHPAVLLFDPAHTEALVHSDAFTQGRATVQGETALAAAELVAARPGERVLELCAAPGGKTAVLVESGASVLATDLHPPRMTRLRETLLRLCPTAVVETLVSDGTAAVPAGTFDAVLIDAPCSNTGVLAKRPSARWRFGPAARAALHELQARLLREAAERVRPGGRLVWSTCSLEPEENAQLVHAFVEANAGWEVEVEHEALPSAGKARPSGDPQPSDPDASPRPLEPVDGGYRARLRRLG